MMMGKVHDGERNEREREGVCILPIAQDDHSLF